MRRLWFLAAVAIITSAFAAVANAASCDVTSLTSLLASTDSSTCASDSGYAVTSLATPTDDQLALMCASTACQSVISQLTTLAPSECTLDTFALYADLITPFEDACGSSSDVYSDVSSVSGSSSHGYSAVTVVREPVGYTQPEVSSFSTSSTGSSTSEENSTTDSSTASSASESTSGSSSTPTTETSISGANSTDAQSSSSTSDVGSSSSSGGLGTGAIVGIIVGVVLLVVLLLLALCIIRRRKTRQAGIGSPDSPVLGKRIRLLEDDTAPANMEHQDSRSNKDSKTLSTEGSQGSSHGTGSGGIWEDPIIIAARISIDRIKLGALIGCGGFGEVYQARYRDQTVAVKTLLPGKRKDLVQIEVFLSEIRLMATMEHPYIIQFIGVAWESLSDLYCVTEFMAGGDLRSLLQTQLRNDTPQGLDASKTQIAYQVAYALTYLHSLAPVVLHRDLKSRNILLTESLDAKITDFGASRVRSSETMTAGVGSWMWMAPEVMLGEHYDEKADIFSFGVVLSELDTHELPYSHAKGSGLPDAAIMQMLSMGKMRIRFSRFLDADTARFAERCVSLDPRERPTAAEVLYFFQVVRSQRSREDGALLQA